MQIPLIVAFHNLESSDAVKTRVAERVAKLESIYDRLTGCHVTIEADKKRPNGGHDYNVRIEMSVPGGEPIVISGQPHHGDARGQGPDVYDVVNQSFDVAERRLRKFKDKQRGDVKHHG